MRKMSLGTLAIIAALMGVETRLAAQTGVPAVGGVGGGATSRPRRKLHRNANPALSPALNLVPGVSSSFEGQFLLRQIPQEQFLRANAQTNRNFDRLENQLGEQQRQIQTGIGKTGHTVSYLNYGRYYQKGAGGGGGGGGGH
ncbi:MAG TPA: hypothetical protein VGH74_17870 [Planctomycetaceae bacterium]|jgi:hypothetical protein